MFRKLLLFLFIIPLAIFSAPPIAKEMFKGRVIDSISKEGIPSAVVELKNSNLGVGYYKVITGKDGSFQIDDYVKGVNYKLEIVADGYVSFANSVVPDLIKDPIELVKEGIISGKVIDSQQKPLENVEVSVKLSNYFYFKTKIVKTDSKGEYKVEKLPSDSYSLSFKKDGYITETAVIEKVNVGEEFNLPMQLHKPATISGTIVVAGMDDKVPANNIRITLNGHKKHEGYSYVNGSYKITDIKPGKFKLNYSHSGFKNVPEKVITITEGENKIIDTLHISPKNAEVSISTQRYTIPSGKSVEFDLKSLRLEKVKVTIKKVSIKEFLNPSSKTNPDSSIVKTWEEAIKKFTPYNWKHQVLTIAEPLPIGTYSIEVNGEDKAIDKKYFTVTSTGIVVKRSQNSIFVYSTNLVDNKPVKTSIVLFELQPNKTDNFVYLEQLTEIPGKIHYKGQSNEEGIFHTKFQSNKRIYVFAIAEDGSFALCDSGYPGDYSYEIEKYFIYTDRPVYRPGHTVFFKLIAKERQQKFLPIPNAPREYTIKKMNSKTILAQEKFSTDEWGAFHGKLQLPDKVPPGRYQIYLNNEYGDAGTFYVEEYRKPEFKVEVKPNNSYYTNSQKAEFKVEAKYFFGAPLKNALVTYRFYESRIYDGNNTYWWESDEPNYHTNMRVRLEGEKYLDDNGNAVLSIDCGDLPYDRELKLEVSVLAPNNTSITESNSVSVGRGEFYVKIRPEYNFYSTEEEKKITITSLDHTGKPVPANLEVKIYRFIWKSWQRVYLHDEIPMYSSEIKTDDNGQYVLDLKKELNQPGEIDIIITGKDSKENLITANSTLWLYDAKGRKVDSRMRNLELSLKKDTIKEAGDITVLLKSKFTDLPVLITLEGKDVYDHKLVWMKDNLTPVTLNIKSDYSPNLFIKATMQKNSALFNVMEELNFPHTDTEIKINLETDKEQYQPGETVSIKVKTTDEKLKPIPSDVSIAVVDEAIFSIRKDFTPNMQSFFYTKVSNWVSTNYSFPMFLLAGSGKDGQPKDIRREFKDTAYWNASVHTDNKGEANINFILPDNLTQWRITSRAHDLQGRLGEIRKKFTVSKDIIAGLGRPRFLVEGDSIQLIGTVHNLSGKGLDNIQTEMKINSNPVLPVKDLKISLPDNGNYRAFYPYTVPSSTKEAKIFFSAKADKTEDSLELPIPIHSKGHEYRYTLHGDLTNNKEVKFKNPVPIDGVEFKPEAIEILFHPILFTKVMSAIESIHSYPYDCTEQMISKAMPAFLLEKVWEKKKYKVPDSIKKINSKLRSNLDKVLQSQNYDGTWGYWYGDRGNEFLTGYAMLFLNILSRNDIVVDKYFIERGLDAIKRILKEEGKITTQNKAYLLYVLSLYGEYQDDSLVLFDTFKDLDTASKALLVASLDNFEKISNGTFPSITPVENSQPIEQPTNENSNSNVEDPSVNDPNDNFFDSEEDSPGPRPKNKILPKSKLPDILKNRTAYLNNLKESIKIDGMGMHLEGNSFTRTEATSLGLVALLSEKDSSPMVQSFMSSISQRYNGYSWSSTKESSMALLAILQYIQDKGIEINQKGSVEFKLQENIVASFDYDSATTPSNLEMRKYIPIDKVDDFYNQKVTASSKGFTEASFGVIVHGTLYFKKDLPVNESLAVERSFYNIARIKDVNSQEYLVPTEVNWNELTVGQEIMVKLRFRSTTDLESIVIEDFLPSGFEIIQENAYKSGNIFSHSEKRDNKIAYFMNFIYTNDVYEIAYIMRAELPGTFYMKPTKLESMYDPSIITWSSGLNLKVKNKE